ncbi:MAG: DUF4193 family protein [Actinomycetota bacterium]
MIADEQDLERIEDEETEEDLVDEALVDELDEDVVDEIDILDEDDDLEETSEEAETSEEEEAEEDDEDADDVAEDSNSTSLDELLAQRTAARQGTDDSDDDDAFIALSSEAARKESRTRSKIAPLRNREEFVCKSCFLLKPKVQLADSERMLCRDCV